jgi:hypothetical protein
MKNSFGMLIFPKKARSQRAFTYSSLGLFLARSFAELARNLDLLITALPESSEYLPTTFTYRT